jgi:hypothetical protein
MRFSSGPSSSSIETAIAVSPQQVPVTFDSN